MANEKVDEMIDEILAIRQRHEQDEIECEADREFTAGAIMNCFGQAHKDRATLLAEIERLRVMLNPPEESLELSRAAQRMLDYMKETGSHLPLYNAYRDRQQAEARLAELVGRLRAELDACDVEEMAYCGGGDGPCGGPAQQPDTVERVRAVLADF